MARESTSITSSPAFSNASYATQVLTLLSAVLIAVLIRHIPQGKVHEVPEVGIFACRCPQRPNPVGVSTVEIVGIKGNIISVKGLDVIRDTPIIDMKPYTPQYDAAPNAKVPDWVSKLEY